jgi:hypothetical protein
MAVPNQKKIITKRPANYAAGEFITLPQEELKHAWKDLSPSARIIWIKLAGNANNYVDEFSPSYYVDAYGGCTKSYQKGRQELEDKGYIVKHNNEYWFYLLPQTATATIQEPVVAADSPEEDVSEEFKHKREAYLNGAIRISDALI